MTELLVGVNTLGAIVALLVALRALKRSHTEELVIAIFADNRWEKMMNKIFENARESAKTAAADRVQMLLNTRDYMPRELQSQVNQELERRVAAIERKIDDVPVKTAREVIIALAKGGKD
jgi:hypothetical protein